MKTTKDLENSIKNEEIFFCPRLFDHIYSQTDGTYSVCCIGGSPNDKETVHDTKPLEWYHSDKLNKIRTEMLTKGSDLEYTKKHCFRCLHQENNYNSSDRIRHNNMMFRDHNKHIKSHILNQVLDFVNTGKAELKHRVLIIQTRIFGNQCNLDCYMCQPSASSTRQLMNKKVNYSKHISFDPNAEDFTKINQTAVIDDLVELAPYIDRIMLQGGEPLVMKKQYELLDKLLETDHAKHIVLEMNSNLTILGESKYNILDYIPKFRQLNINASLDGVGKYNDYIRRRSNWEDILKNIEILRKFDNVVFDVFSTVSTLSVLRYNEIEEFAKINNWPLCTYIVDDPDELHIKHLPQKIKDTLLKKYKHNSNIVNALQMDGSLNKFNSAINYIKQQDKFYNTDVYTLYPELKEFESKEI